MIDRICISINNRCNLSCKYCHFHDKRVFEDAEMDIFKILDNVKKYATGDFKIGFVGNGEALLDWPKLKSYIVYIEDHPNISVYIITNGTVSLKTEDWLFLKKHKVNVGFSIDGPKDLHDKNRCGSFDKAIQNVEEYKRIMQAKEFKAYRFEELNELPFSFNENVCKALNKDSFILTSGHERVWSFISSYLDIPFYSGAEMAAETKFFITKMLQKAGKTINAYGDGMNDYYMLKQADKGYLVTKADGTVSKSLKGKDLGGIEFV